MLPVWHLTQPGKGYFNSDEVDLNHAIILTSYARVTAPKLAVNLLTLDLLTLDLTHVIW